MKNHPALHAEHQFDRALLDQALNWLEHSHTPRDLPVPLTSTLTLPETLPDTGLGTTATLDLLAPMILQSSAQLHHPGYFAHMDPPTPGITWAASLWQVATNQNPLHPDAGPMARSLAERVIEWLLPSFGMSGGHFVPGSTIANMTALWAARELRGITTVAASDKSHLSMRKAADILGLNYVSVPTDDAHVMRVDEMPNLSDAALVLTAGTVATGAVDNLHRPDGVSWLHVDAAWAGPLRLTNHYADRLAGITAADSVGFSAHKWLYQPKGSALVMFQEAEEAHQALSYGGGYLATPNIGLLGSTPAAAVPLAAMLLSWGRNGLIERIEADMAKADQLAALVSADSRFELWGPNRTGVVVWRPRDAQAEEIRSRLKQAWVSLTEINGEMWLRSVAANPSADPDFLFAQVVDAL